MVHTYALRGMLFCLFLATCGALFGDQNAVFIKPVSQLCSEQLSKYGTKNLAELYNNQPLSWVNNAKFDCMRTAQALFNEWCRIVASDEHTGEVGVQLDHFLVDNRGTLEPATFWTLAENLFIPTQETKKVFPASVSYKDVKSLRACNTIVLKAPFFDATSKIAFSVGTRFVRVADNDTDQCYAAVYFDLHNHENPVRELQIPVEIALTCDAYRSDEERRANFLHILREWIGTNKKEIIPYVWGGSSYVQRIEDKGFEKQKGKFFDKATEGWVRPNDSSQYGFDCSGLIMRAAQIVGIDYWFKTTHTLYNFGDEVTRFEDLQNGDLIVRPGHVIIVSDKEKGLLIESVGYGNGYGKLHEIELQKRYGIKSFEDFFPIKKNSMNVQELYPNGRPLRALDSFKVFSLFNTKKAKL